jgi:hypothetical protein
LGPLGTAATNRPIVAAPGDYDDREIGGMIIGRGKRGTRRKLTPVPLCPPQIPHVARTRTRDVAILCDIKLPLTVLRGQEVSTPLSGN